jgi:hypothetical protein
MPDGRTLGGHVGLNAMVEARLSRQGIPKASVIELTVQRFRHRSQ